MLAKFG